MVISSGDKKALTGWGKQRTTYRRYSKWMNNRKLYVTLLSFNFYPPLEMISRNSSFFSVFRGAHPAGVQAEIEEGFSGIWYILYLRWCRCPFQYIDHRYRANVRVFSWVPETPRRNKEICLPFKIKRRRASSVILKHYRIKFAINPRMSGVRV